MAKRIAIIQGHPDPVGGHFVPALAQAYEDGAREAGHDVRRIDVARLEFGLLHNAQEWEWKPPPESIAAAQKTLAWAQHVAIFFPLWMGDMPALLKGFFEQVLRPGFAIGKGSPGRMGTRLLKGRSARLVVTMGMPAFFYRIYYRAHSVRSLKRNVLEFCGISPVRTTLIGMVEGPESARGKWLMQMGVLGREAA